MNARPFLIGFLLLFLCTSALAAQHGHLVFDVDGWTPLEQSSDRHIYERGDLRLTIRATANEAMPQEVFAEYYDADVEDFDGTNAFIARTDEHVLIAADYQGSPELYRFVLIAPVTQEATARAEMRAFLDSLSLSDELVLAEAPWERELAYPDELPFLERHPIPWDWIIILVVVGLFVYWRIRKWKAKKAAKHEKKNTEEHPAKHAEKKTEKHKPAHAHKKH